MANQYIPVRAHASKAMRFDQANMITIRAGEEPDQQDFIAHATFLTSRSNYFERALNGPWEEAESRVVKFPKEKPQTIALYVNYIYTGHINTIRKSNEELAALEPKDLTIYTLVEYRALFNMYLLAERVQDAAAKKAAITAAFEVSTGVCVVKNWIVPSIDTINAVYNGTTERSPARRFVTDCWSAVCINTILKMSQKVHLHVDFRRDLAASLEKIRPKLPGQGGNIIVDKGLQAYLVEV